MSKILIGAVTAIAILTTGASSAEVSVDVFIGGAYTDVSFGGESGSLDDSFEGGVRATAWLNDFDYVGISGGLSMFQPLQGFVDLYVVPITIQVMLRYPLLRDDEFAHGRIQPYLGIGGGLFSTVVGVDGEIEDDETEVDGGVDIRLGIAGLLTPTISAFGEYRYTEFKSRGLTYETNYIQFGVSYHF